MNTIQLSVQDGAAGARPDLTTEEPPRKDTRDSSTDSSQGRSRCLVPARMILLSFHPYTHHNPSRRIHTANKELGSKPPTLNQTLQQKWQSQDLNQARLSLAPPTLQLSYSSLTGHVYGCHLLHTPLPGRMNCQAILSGSSELYKMSVVQRGLKQFQVWVDPSSILACCVSQGWSWSSVSPLPNAAEHTSD